MKQILLFILFLGLSSTGRAEDRASDLLKKRIAERNAADERARISRLLQKQAEAEKERIENMAGLSLNTNIEKKLEALAKSPDPLSKNARDIMEATPLSGYAASTNTFFLDGKEPPSKKITDMWNLRARGLEFVRNEAQSVLNSINGSSVAPEISLNSALDQGKQKVILASERFVQKLKTPDLGNLFVKLTDVMKYSTPDNDIPSWEIADRGRHKAELDSTPRVSTDQFQLASGFVKSAQKAVDTSKAIVTSSAATLAQMASDLDKLQSDLDKALKEANKQSPKSDTQKNKDENNGKSGGKGSGSGGAGNGGGDGGAPSFSGLNTGAPQFPNSGEEPPLVVASSNSAPTTGIEDFGKISFSNPKIDFVPPTNTIPPKKGENVVKAVDVFNPGKGMIPTSIAAQLTSLLSPDKPTEQKPASLKPGTWTGDGGMTDQFGGLGGYQSDDFAQKPISPETWGAASGSTVDQAGNALNLIPEEELKQKKKALALRRIPNPLNPNRPKHILGMFMGVVIQSTCQDAKIEISICDLAQAKTPRRF